MTGSSSTPITIRGVLPEGADGERLNRLAAITGRRPPQGPVLLAEIDGHPVAAVGIFDRRAISDPARSGIALRLRLRLTRLSLRLIVAVHGL